MTVAVDLATLHPGNGCLPACVICAARKRVEAEIARLDGNFRDAEILRIKTLRRAEAAEAEVARLRDGLRRRNELIAKTIYNPPGWTGPDMWWADEARALLAEDGAACEHDYVYVSREVYRCDKCDGFSSDGVYPRIGGAA